jgi:hypothetical protein
MRSQRVVALHAVHGSIPHHERKIKYLRFGQPVSPEVSEGEPFPSPALVFSQSIVAATSCGQILLDPQGEIAHAPFSEKGFLITSPTPAPKKRFLITYVMPLGYLK